MRKFILIFATIFVAFFVLNNNVYAEDNKCTAVERNELTKRASNVVASYEFVYNQINEVIGLNYLIYNVPSDMDAEYYISNTAEEYAINNYIYVDVDRETGIGKVFDPNLTDTYKVSFRVYSRTSKCTGALKTVSFRKVKHNEYADLDLCKYEGMEDYTYCQQWIDQNFPYDRLQIIARIEKQLESLKTKTTTICISCGENEKNNSIYETIVKIRFYAIIGLSIGIFVDFIVIIISIKRVKESRL